MEARGVDGEQGPLFPPGFAQYGKSNLGRIVATKSGRVNGQVLPLERVKNSRR